MSIWRLVVHEILYRKLSFGLGVLSVAVAVGCLVGAVVLLVVHDLRAERVFAEHQAKAAKDLAELEDEIRKITKNLGFNVRILPKDVNLLQFYAADYADKYMPQEYAERLSKAKIVTINHLLPTLQQKVEWPEQKTFVVVIGTVGELPMLYQSRKKPIQDIVPKGKIVLGYLLHDRLSKAKGRPLKTGDPVEFQGKTFTVYKLHPKRGDQDDITLWLHLHQAQDMLNKTGLINGILALGCNCADLDRLGTIRKEIEAILPDTQVEEFETKATARAETRNKVAAEAQAAMTRLKGNQTDVRREKEAFAAVLVPLVLIACCVWLGLLAWNNVRERKTEIGLLRALGLRTEQLFVLFLSRALLIGLVGAVLGLAAAFLAVTAWDPIAGQNLEATLDPALLVAVLVGAPLIGCLACWLPALLATRQDPAAVLQTD
jgi:hypothetical protein